jgi:repressor LexA
MKYQPVHRCVCCGALWVQPRPLTRRQHELCEFLRSFIERHGYAPSFQEIADALGLSSLATIHEHLTNLERKGAIRRYPNARRGISVTVGERSR